MIIQSPIVKSKLEVSGSSEFEQFVNFSGGAAGSFTGSFIGDGSGLGNLDISSLDTSTLTTTSSFNSYTSSTNGRIDSLESYSSSLNSAISINGSNVTILGNLEVAGTQTIIDSTVVQISDNIIELNGTGAVNGGLRIRDVTGPNTVSGSLLWDTTNDIWIAGALGSESKILLANGDGVVSGSSQIDINTTNGTLNVNKGGTGVTSVTSGQILFGNGTSPIGGSARLFWDNSNNILKVSASLETTGSIISNVIRATDGFSLPVGTDKYVQ
jgi:hypothetical protein